MALVGEERTPEWVGDDDYLGRAIARADAMRPYVRSAWDRPNPPEAGEKEETTVYHPENDYPYHGFHPGDQPTWLKWLTPSVAIVTVLVLLALASCARPAYAQGCISPEFVAGKMQTGDFQPEGRRLSPQKSVAYLALVGHEHPNGQSPDFFVVLYRAKNETMTRVFEFEGGCYAGYFDVEDPEA